MILKASDEVNGKSEGLDTGFEDLDGVDMFERLDALSALDKAETMEDLLAGMVLGNFCLNCGNPLLQKPVGRHRHFCCKACSREYWKENPRPDRWHSYERVRCGYCRKYFYARKDAHRKYCSISCSNKARGIRRILSDSNPAQAKSD